jgi:hypothetical protein
MPVTIDRSSTHTGSSVFRVSDGAFTLLLHASNTALSEWPGQPLDAALTRLFHAEKARQEALRTEPTSPIPDDEVGTVLINQQAIEAIRYGWSAIAGLRIDISSRGLNDVEDTLLHRYPTANAITVRYQINRMMERINNA